MVQLEEVVAVERHHGEAVGRPDAELGPQPVGQSGHPVEVAGVGGDVVAVEDGLLVGAALNRRQQVAVVDQLLHDASGYDGVGVGYSASR